MVCASNLEVEGRDSGVGGGDVGVEIGFCNILRQCLTPLLSPY